MTPAAHGAQRHTKMRRQRSFAPALPGQGHFKPVKIFWRFHQILLDLCSAYAKSFCVAATDAATQPAEHNFPQQKSTTLL
jgi:hypothetical protein